MKCSFTELRKKTVVNLADGSNLGFVDDIEIDTETLALKSMVIYGRENLFGLLGRDDDTIINVGAVTLIGRDTILINTKARFK